MQRLVLAGTGFMAETHVPQWQRMDDVSVEAVVSPSGPEPFLDRHGLDAAAYTDTVTACEESDADAVDVCTPTHTHADIVDAAADHGLAIFCEKPLARSLDEAAAIRDTVREAGVQIMVGHVLRYFPQYAAAKREVDAGVVGRPGVARARRLSPFPQWGSANWFADPDKSGGVFLDLAIHDLDYLRWVWGDVDRVFARRTGDGARQHGTVTLRFANGATGYVEASWAQPDSRELTTSLEFAGDEGVVAVDSEDARPYREFTGDEVTVESPVAEDGYYRELAHFVDCLENGIAPDVGIGEAMAAMRLSLAARRSAASGTPVAPAEVDA
ncbi:Gfo/Idh/MocA family protein [Halomicrococcus sp. NG-SE-24]|uniref:Gfo/Idh/MocA family protein n=1 Tax=Halomicrococcus sp. NG-SE-24 TaxID=3436928 RepID=UPI003D97C3C4